MSKLKQTLFSLKDADRKIIKEKLKEKKEKLKEKDDKIKQLEQELAEMTRKYEFSCRPVGGLVDTAINLEKQLAELKENAIVPKFRIGQEVFVVDNECQIAQGVVDVILTGQDVFEKWCKYSIDLGVEYEDDIRFIDKNEEEIFATKEETQDKLKEIQGNE